MARVARGPHKPLRDTRRELLAQHSPGQEATAGSQLLAQAEFAAVREHWSHGAGSNG